MSAPDADGVRINKFLASCGLGSRRNCEQLVSEGRVTLNGTPVRSLSTRVQPDDAVKVDTRRVWPETRMTILFNKPKGYLCTQRDTHDRKTIYDLLPGRFRRLNYIGRLDKDSEGLLLLTSDGQVAQKLTHPRHEIEKEYHVLLDRPLEAEAVPKLLYGIRTPDGVAKAERIEDLGKRWVSVVLQQGIKRQIRLMFGRFDYEVKKLVRVRIGNLVAPNLEPGKFVELDDEGLELALSNPKLPQG